MIAYVEARALALSRLAELEAEMRDVARRQKALSSQERVLLELEQSDENLRLAIIEDHTIAGDFGWGFFLSDGRIH